MKNIVIVGAGGFGREVKFLIDEINKSEIKFKILGFYDDNFETGIFVNGIKVLGKISEINLISEKTGVVFAIGNPLIKEQIISSIKNPNLFFPTLIHPNVIISTDDVTIGHGCIICAGTIITCNIKIEDFTILNLSCTVGHDTTIGKYSSFMPSVNISGEVIIENKVYVGTGAKIINQLTIGENSIIGAGAVVSKDIPKNCTAVGIPAKPIKFH
jgi:sugar O-acyltransferase (sialic acid O-acetyltransferase NeuD family)